ncbi:hypothetical protein AGMMS4952_27580 [Spirochaetia bacterium]|nr:hypothetical protein AGMMS4952_27580 [Spirochaetia bacterium]
MLSRFTIRPDLKIPGRFGELTGESFRIFAVIMDRKKVITRKNLMGDIDHLMLELSEDMPEEPTAAGETAVKRTGAAGFIILTLIVLLAWSPWALMFGLFR